MEQRIRFEANAGEPPGIDLQRLVRLHLHHREGHRNALPGNLFDGMLIQRNPVYRLIREQVCALGYEFSAIQNETVYL